MKAFETTGIYDDKGKLSLKDNLKLKNEQVKVIILVPEQGDKLSFESDDFLKLSAENLSRAYSDNEPEYTTENLIEVNPGYHE